MAKLLTIPGLCALAFLWSCSFTGQAGSEVQTCYDTGHGIVCTTSSEIGDDETDADGDGEPDELVCGDADSSSESIEDDGAEDDGAEDDGAEDDGAALTGDDEDDDGESDGESDAAGEESTSDSASEDCDSSDGDDDNDGIDDGTDCDCAGGEDPPPPPDCTDCPPDQPE